MDFSLNSNLRGSEDNNMVAKLEGRDRLSELHDSLILSLMEMEDVVRTTILSKHWKDLWTTVPPCLDLCFANRRFIRGALSKWKGAKILKFSIDFKSDYRTKWLLIPIEKQVEELYVDYENNVSCHEFLYSCSSITHLTLDGCNYLKIEENVEWPQLKILQLDGHDYITADGMNRILTGAPLLEKLILRSLFITENFNIQSTSLKILKKCT